VEGLDAQNVACKKEGFQLPVSFQCRCGEAEKLRVGVVPGGIALPCAIEVVPDPLAHLSRCLVGEGKGEDLLRMCHQSEQVQETGGEQKCFPGARGGLEMETHCRVQRPASFGRICRNGHRNSVL